NTAYTMNKTPKLSWSGAVDTHISKVEYRIGGDNYTSLGTAASGMKELSLTKTGEYPFTVRAVDLAGNVSAVKIFSYFLDVTGPDVPSNGLRITDSTGKNITSWSKEENPKLSFSGVKELESNLLASGLSYEILNDKKQLVVPRTLASNVILTNASGTYSGTYELGNNAKNLESGIYTIRTKWKDTLGNETVASANNPTALELTYKKDILPPELDLAIENIAETVEAINLKDLSGEKFIHLSATEKPADISTEETQKRIKKVSLVLVDSKGESKEFLANSSIDEGIIFNTEEYKNGKYELILSAEDILGNKSEKKQDIEIANRIEPPKAFDVMTNKDKAELKWQFLGDDNISGVEYKAPESNEWVREETEEKTGTVRVSLPKEEGDYEAELRCVDEDGLTGLIKKVNIEVDKTPPQISELKIDRGIIYGYIEDKNGYEYKIYIKEEGTGEANYQELAYKSAEKGERRLGIIDISREEFSENSLFDIKLVATDGAGNESSKIKVTFKEEGTLYPNIEEPKYRIKRPKSQRYENSTIYLSTNTKKLELEAVEGAVPAQMFAGIKWFVDGKADTRKEYTHEKYIDDFTVNLESSKYEEDVSYPVSASLYGINGKASFSRTVVKNRDVIDVSFNSEDKYGVAKEEIDGIYKEVEIDKSIVGLTLMGSGKARTGADLSYEIGTSKDDLTRVKIGENYGIYEITGKEVSVDKLLIKISSNSYLEKDLVRGIKLGIDVLDIENFKLRSIENYAALNVSAQDKINYKTYIRWDFEGENADETGSESGNKVLPEDVSFEIFRGETENFFPSDKNKIASGIKENYYADINVAYSKTSYYKVRAVRVKEGRLESSSCSLAAKSIGVDASEYSKRLGIKDYLSYSETGTPVGTISVEKSAGNLVYTQTDASINSENLPMDFERVYNSQSSSKSAFGIGMSHSFDIELLNISEETDDRFKKLAFKDETGSIFLFSKVKGETGRYISTSGGYLELKEAEEDKPFVDEPEVFDSLNTKEKKKVKIESQYRVLTKDNVEYKFNTGGQLLLMKEQNGNVLLFNYDESTGRLTKVSNTLGLSIAISYGNEDNEDHALIKKVSLPDGGSVNYDYTKEKLTKVTRKASKAATSEQAGRGSNAEEISYTYKYDSKILSDESEDNLTEISDGEGNIYSLEYDATFNDDKNNKKAKAKRVILPRDESKGIFAKESYKEYEYSTASDGARKIATGKATRISYFEEGIFRYQQNDYFTENSNRNTENNGCNYGTGRIKTEEKSLSELGCIEEPADWLVIREYRNSMPIKVSTKTDTAKLLDGSIISYSEILKTEKTKYNEEEEIIEEVDEQNNVTEYIYEDKGDRFVAEIAEEYEYYDDEDGEPDLKTVYEYDEYGNEINEKNYVWDEEAGDFVLEDSSKTDYITEEDDKTGKLAGEIEKEIDIDEAGLKTETKYDISFDEEGNKISKTIVHAGYTLLANGEKEGGEITTSIAKYDPLGNEIFSDDGLGNITESYYDGFSRLIKQVNKTGDKIVTIQSKYNNNGSLIYEKNSNGYETYYEYDIWNELIQRRTIFKEETKESKISRSYKDIWINTARGEKKIDKAKVIEERNIKGKLLSATYTNAEGDLVREIAGGLITDNEYTQNGTLISSLTKGETETDLSNARVSLSFTDESTRTNYSVTNPVYDEGISAYKIDSKKSIVESSVFDSTDNVVLSKDALGNETKYEYDNAKNLTSAVSPLGARRDFEYDIREGELAVDKVIDAKGNVSVTKRNAFGEEVEIADLGNGGVAPISTKYEYDNKGRPIKEIDSKGNIKKYIYNSKNQIEKLEYINSDSILTMESSFEYDKEENRTVMADYSYKNSEGNYEDNRILTRYTYTEYDSLGRKTGFAELTRDDISEANRNESEGINPNPSIEEIEKKFIKYKYDIYDDLIEISYSNTLTDIRALKFIYNTSLESNNDSTHKFLVRVDAETNDSIETVREYEYDKNTKVMGIKDYLNFSDEERSKGEWTYTKFAYDSFDRPIKQETTDSSSSNKVKESYELSYDKLGNILTEKIFNDYPSEKKTSSEEADGSSDEVSAKQDELRSYKYDNLGRLEKVAIKDYLKNSDSEDARVEETEYNYDTLGNRLSETDNKGKTEYSYNSLNQLIKVNEGRGSYSASDTILQSDLVKTSSYNYDRAGNQITKE
ncbi:MAG: DUF6531 domain-containing protein, partial [Anaerovoracaceae bacterium]